MSFKVDDEQCDETWDDSRFSQNCIKCQSNTLSTCKTWLGSFRRHNGTKANSRDEIPSIIDLFSAIVQDNDMEQQHTLSLCTLCNPRLQLSFIKKKIQDFSRRRRRKSKKRKRKTQSGDTWHGNLLFIQETNLRKTAKCLTSRLLSVMSSFSDELKHLTDTFGSFLVSLLSSQKRTERLL